MPAMATSEAAGSAPVSDQHAPPKVPHRPYIPTDVVLRELTPVALIVGTLLGIVFGASSLYLVLKVGLTVSASIPVAVISITLFRLASKLKLRNATILENNVVQTAGSAGESIAFGVGVTMPAIMILGFDLEIARVTLVAVLGGLLGILMMIPLRRALIVEQHGILKYPEGTACAEVLKAGASDESREVAERAGTAEPGAVAAAGGRTVFFGFGVGLLYKTAMVALRGWKDIPEKVFTGQLKAGSVAAEISPELLGVGYIIGPRIASIMCAGGVLAYLVLIPAIKFFGAGLAEPLAPGTLPIGEMSPNQIRGAYILYIGAGAVAAGGIISLGRSLPTIWNGIKGGLGDLRGARDVGGVRPRTDRDLSMKTVLIGLLALIAAISISPPLHMNVVGAILIVVFGFLFVTVSSRLTGEIGSSSNPISGMTVATLLLTCGFFVVLGWTGPSYYITALSVGAIVCIAASNGGTTSQDLKTGFLVGATPRYQQIAILIGAFASAIMLGPILLRLNDASTVYVPRVSFERPAQALSLPSPLVAELPGYEGPQPAAAGSYKKLVQPKGRLALPPGEYLVDASSGNVVQKVTENFPAAMRADPSKLGEREKLQGPQARQDDREYRVWHKIDDVGGPPGKYLVDETGAPAYLADPGINGVHTTRPDGSRVSKFDAPKATLMSYIIKGILNQELPWSLVLLGVMIAVVLEMAGIPSLAFAVGVYLPISSSAPIFVGGMIRWLVDRHLRQKLAVRRLSEEEIAAESDKSPGVLLASGYIAGGAIAGILIAFLAGVYGDLQTRIEEWSKEHNPLFAGPNADVLALLPFLVIIGLLYAVGRELVFRPPTTARS
jgi:putative OPT family oligopeptide transporter